MQLDLEQTIYFGTKQNGPGVKVPLKLAFEFGQGYKEMTT